MRKELLAVVVLLSACCCQGTRKNQELLRLTEDASTQLAKQYSDVLEKEYPPAGCVLSLSKATPFGKHLWIALQEKGYSLSDAPIQGATPVSYLVDNLGEGLGLSVVSIGEKLRVSRSFSVLEPLALNASMTVERRQE